MRFWNGQKAFFFNKIHRKIKIPFHRYSRAILGIERFLIGLAVLCTVDKRDLCVNWIF